MLSITTDFRSSENGFKVLSRVAFATKVFRRLLSPCSWWRKLEIHARKTFESGPDFKVFFSLDRKSVVLQISDHLRQKTQSWVFSKRLRGFSTCEKTHSLSSREQKQMKTRHLPKHSHVFVANSFSSINCVTLLESRKPFESFRKDSARLKWSEICSIVTTVLQGV